MHNDDQAPFRVIQTYTKIGEWVRSKYQKQPSMTNMPMCDSEVIYQNSRRVKFGEFLQVVFAHVLSKKKTQVIYKKKKNKKNKGCFRSHKKTEVNSRQIWSR